ncbi:MAG TPA: tripartite tricarboxylate transporter substrate binding protein [Burkholderiales bacterium]|nr:tripartite tricarboxylate transporter substrate binding protein [Burkholderiales bacterium]
MTYVTPSSRRGPEPRPKYFLPRAVACVAAVAVTAAAMPSFAQALPKQVRLMVGFAAGGASDITARMVAPKIAEALGVPVIVENRGGSGGMIATDMVAKSPPDGSTLLLMPAADTVQPAVRRKLPYDLERDFAPVSRIVTGPWFLIVHPTVPARNVKELVALAKSHPGKLNYATSGVGSSAHMSTLVFSGLANVSLVHVPYKGTSDGVTATAAGETDMIFASIPASLPLLSAKKVRALGVSTRERTVLAPDMPTLHESGVPGYDRSGWYGILAPAAVPRDFVTRLNAIIVKVANTREMKEAFNRQGLETATTTPEEFARFIRSEVAQNVKAVQKAGVKID